MSMILAFALALQSLGMPQNIPGLLAELQSLIAPELANENPEKTTRYTVNQVLEAEGCRVKITRTLRLAGAVNENLRRETTFDLGDNYMLLTDWKNERGFPEILFRPLAYEEPFPVILEVDLATPNRVATRAGSIGIEFQEEWEMVRAMELLHFLRQRCEQK